MELGVNSAVLHYNEVACGISMVFSYFKIDNGYYMEKGGIKRNKVTIRKMDIKSSEDWKIFIILLFIYLFIYSLFKVDKFTIKTDIIRFTTKNSYVLIIKIKTC